MGISSYNLFKGGNSMMMEASTDADYAGSLIARRATTGIVFS